MPRLTPSTLISTLLCAVVGLYALWKSVSFILTGMEYSLESKHSSPNGKMTIYEFQSLQDGQSHAPYGTLLSLSFGEKLKHPDDGYVFFAGYCSPPIKYQWISNDRIYVSCREKNSIQTLSTLMYGIKVEFSDSGH